MLFFVFAFFFLIVMPTVLGSLAIMTDHRRKMAQIQSDAGAGNERIGVLERQMGEMAALVHEQTIALDNLTGFSPRERLEERVR